VFPPSIRRELARTEHGGAVGRGKRKTERPVSTRRPMHLVMKSDRAHGAWSLQKHAAMVRATLRVAARRNQIRGYALANVGTHLHLLIRVRRRTDFQRFLRSFTGLVARRITGARRGAPRGRFWGPLVWSRIVAWGRDYYGVRHYVFRNEIEAAQGPAVRR